MSARLVLTFSLSMVGAGTFSGCAIDNVRDGIGADCVVDDGACPLDHICRPTNLEAPAAGLCAPVADYGDCGEATHPQRTGSTRDEDLDAFDAAEVKRLDDDEIAIVNGDVFVGAESAGQVLVLEDLCQARSLQVVTGRLQIRRTNLVNLDGLQGLGRVGGGIVVAQNPQLVSLDGLFNIMSTGDAGDDVDDLPASVVIAQNARLPEAALRAFKDRLRVQSPSVTVFACDNINAAAVDDDTECPVF